MASFSTNFIFLLFRILVYFDNSICFESLICEYEIYVIQKTVLDVDVVENVNVE